MKIGGHISTAGGLHTGFERAKAIGAECMQVFESPPQQWGTAKLTDEQVEQFRAARDESGIAPIFIHGKYLMNLASPDPKVFKTSVSTLRSSLNIAHRIGAVGVIFHTGSHKGIGVETVYDQICEAATGVLAETPSETLMIFENSAGQGGTMGSKFTELGEIIRRLDNRRAKVCIDTCHAFASGYDLSNVDGVAATIDELSREVGMQNVAAFHCNDSKAALGSGRDLHENIGEGYIGRAGFEALLARPEIQDIPLLLEVPGYKIDGAGKGPDKPNIDLMKEIRAGATSGGSKSPAAASAKAKSPAAKKKA